MTRFGRGSNQGQNEKSPRHQSSIDFRCYLEMALFEPRPGMFTRMFEAASDDPDMEYAMVDATIVRVHRHGQGAKGGPKTRPSARLAAA